MSVIAGCPQGESWLYSCHSCWPSCVCEQFGLTVLSFFIFFTSNLSFGKLLFISLGCSKIGCKSAVFFTVVFNQELQNVLGQEYWHWFNQHRTSGLEEKDNTFQFEWYYTANWKYFGWYFSFDVAELVHISLMESEQAHKWAKTDNRLHSERNFAYYPPCKRT